MQNTPQRRLIEGEDYYFEGGLLVFTRQYHLRRGFCCGSGCRHCPYAPRGEAGTTTLAKAEQEDGDERKPF
ncbi:MAG: DUF5522 domain-containing protein [Blastocatellia bacterium]|nr:DUF5522 domain-containing protein [Blastocatellia bacterium]